MSRLRESFIGPYRVEFKIGEGGMGVVYKCYDSKLKRPVALKVLREKYSRNQQYRDRLKREAQAIASLSHPNIAQIYAIEEDNDTLPYLVMECIDGSSAESLLNRPEDISPRFAITIIQGAAAGLKAAVEKGIIHRDVKPSNILIVANGSQADTSLIKLVDFGLAKEIEGAQAITDEGIVLGTPQYISPEQGRGQKVDHRSDIYSLGATFYHLVTGRTPFDGDTQVAQIVARLNEPPKAPHLIREELSEEVSMVIGKMMARDSAQRYQEYDDLIRDVDRLARGQALPPGIATDGAATYRRPAADHRIPSGFWLAAAAAVTLAVGLTLLIASTYWPGPEIRSYEEKLGNWYLRRGEQTEHLKLNFRLLPEGASRSELTDLLFLLNPGDEDRLRIEPDRDGLLMEDLTAPAGLKFRFNRLSEINLQGLRMRGHLDFALAVVDPRGGHLRRLLFVVRSGPPVSAGGQRRVAGIQIEPVRAERNGEPVPLPPLPLAPRLGAGPYDIEVRFLREEKSTRVVFTVRLQGADPVFTTGDSGIELDGTDWDQGMVLLWPSSPLGKSRVTMENLTLTGQIDHDRPNHRIPGERKKILAKSSGTTAGAVEHGKTDRR